LDNIELKQYEEGNFLSIYIGAKPIIKFAMLRLENFISYYLRGPGGLDYKSEVPVKFFILNKQMLIKLKTG